MIPYIKIKKLNMASLPGSNISLTARKGEIVGITGLNGCGKSTFARYLAGINRPAEIGQIIIGGLDPYSVLDIEKLRRMCGMVYQDPRTSVVFDHVGRDIVFGAENLGNDKERIVKRAKHFTKRYSLGKKQNRYYNMLSGSEQQRAALAATLMMNGELLILDEPFSMQGVKESQRYIKTIIESAHKKNQTVVVFSKQREVLELADSVYEMRDGALLEIDINGMNYKERYSSEDKEIKIERYIAGADRKDEKGISLHNVSFGYDDNLIIYKQSARFECGNAYRITGGPGVGKTTYLQLIAGMLRPYEGEVFSGENMKVGYVFQYSEDGFVENTVLDDVMFGPMSDGTPKSEARNMAEAVLTFVGVKENLWKRSPLTLSVGEQRLVSIAGALALGPDFILIDEPYAGLDVNSSRHIEQIIEGLCREGKCIITVEG